MHSFLKKNKAIVKQHFSSAKSNPSCCKTTRIPQWLPKDSRLYAKFSKRKYTLIYWPDSNKNMYDNRYIQFDIHRNPKECYVDFVILVQI